MPARNVISSGFRGMIGAKSLIIKDDLITSFQLGYQGYDTFRESKVI